ncbi:site-specific integrase [Cupriavidus sp. SK-3]|uniref:site-specific integrase n=1 Tax=Cupriavidus sp. SK-3 TaxID=1470558 RepID=UPI0007C69161|nr:site-specific integrase [Cupriavidus sp. SK-3]
MGQSTQPSFAQLPSRATTRSGVVFNPQTVKWVYRDGVVAMSIDFVPAGDQVVSEFLLSMKAVLLWYAENSSAHHVRNLHSRLVHFLEFQYRSAGAPISEISSVDLLNYKTSLAESQAWYLGTLSGLLRKWHRLGYAGVSDAAAALLEDMRTKGNTKGAAVLTMDPVMGPYTAVEHEAIQAALNDAYMDGVVDDGEYFLAWLFMALGQRPAQYAALKVRDLSVATTKEGDAAYILRVPRAKQSNAHLRADFKERPLISQIGGPLLKYVQRVRARFMQLLDDPSGAPMFPQKRPRDMAEGYEYHHTGTSLGLVLKAALNRLEVLSERTGKRAHISPVKFRRTFGTRAAQEGHGELVIAEMLDHSDTQNVGVYVAAVPEIAQRIDRAVAMSLAPLAQAFKGVVIHDESEASRAGDPSSRIIDLRIDRSAKPMGSCGQHSFCSFSAPIACYTCRSFEPWLDGPHEAVLTHLLDKREQLLRSTDERLASVNDRTILAVAQVVHICEMRRNSSNG